MARLYPSDGPIRNKSYSAEPAIYQKLKELPDDFIVIHSVAWFGGALNSKGRSIGEIDFVILHAELGILTLSVKGGAYRFENNRFVHTRTNQIVNVIDQARDGVGGLNRLLLDKTGEWIGIGHAFAFPECEFDQRMLPPGMSMYYKGKQENLCIGRSQLAQLPKRIIEIMQLWKSLHKTRAFAPEEIENIRKLLSPEDDYSPRWIDKIGDDNEKWLKLTEEQYEIVERAIAAPRTVINGFAGTGKTLIAIHCTRILRQSGKRVLFLTYNKRLVDRVKEDLEVDVIHFHGLCSIAAKRINENIADYPDWSKHYASQHLHAAISENKMERYDALVIDEAQVFAADWLTILAQWFDHAPIVACCDETQVFPFESENSTSPAMLAEILGAPAPFLLTVNLRSPLPVYNRLKSIVTTQYQTFSQRKDKPDRLREIVSNNPDEDLKRALRGLKAENVPAHSIVILYLYKPPVLDAELRGMVREISLIYQFRGLEAPIVIVWAGTYITSRYETSLICAYTRATTLLIAIYDAIGLSIANANSFGRKLLKSGDAADNHKKVVDKYWPFSKTHPVEQIRLETVALTWSLKWGVWIFEYENNEVADYITLTLWKDYLRFSSRIGEIVKRTRTAHLRLDTYLPIASIDATIRYDQRQRLMWCEQCDRWAIHTGEDDNFACAEHDDEPYVTISQDVQARIGKYDAALANWNTLDQVEKRQFPVSLLALAYWRTLEQEQQRLLLQMPLETKPRPIENIALVMLACDLAKSSVGDVVNLHELRKTYVAWFSGHEGNTTPARWSVYIDKQMAFWLQQGVVENGHEDGSYIFRGFNNLK